MSSAPYPHGLTVEIWRAEAGTDEYGNATAGSFAKLVAVPGCAVAPRKELELVTNGRTGVILGWTVYAPHGTDVKAHDQVRILDEQYEVEGEPGVWDSPFTGWKPGVEINIRKVTG